MKSKIFGVFGASGFGREVMPVARSMSELKGSEFVFVDDNPPAPEANGHRVLSYSEFVHADGVKEVVVAIGDGVVRREIEHRCVNDGIRIGNVVASNLIQMDGVTMGAGSILCPFVTLTSNINIGRSFQANIYSYVAHDCIIGDYVTFAPSVRCNGNIRIESNAYIGTGAVIKQGEPGNPIVIGEGAIVGMGAVVTKSIDAGMTVIGNPAKPIERRI